MAPKDTITHQDQPSEQTLDLDNNITGFNSQNDLSLSIKQTLKNYKLEPDINGLKKFLTEKEFQDARHLGIKMLGCYSGDYMEYIWSILNNSDRAIIFPNNFEIGCPHVVEFGNREANSPHPNGYQRYLEQTYRGGKDPYKLINQIKITIKNLTGIDFDAYLQADASLAYKVITLFFRVIKLNKPKLLSFIEDGRCPTKMNFEYSTMPYSCSKQSVNDSIILSELITSLMLHMPPEYFKLARYIREKLIQNIQNGAIVLNNNIIKGGLTLEDTRQSMLVDLERSAPIPCSPMLDRLDFKLVLALILKDYEVKVRSNHILNQTFKKYPLSIKSLHNISVLNMTERDKIAHFLGRNDFDISASSDLEVKLIEQILTIYRANLSTRPLNFNPTQIALIKAVIIHDTQLEIRIPSTIHGATYTPDLVGSIFRDIKPYYEKHGYLRPLHEFNNSILCYWDLRIKRGFGLYMKENTALNDKRNWQIVDLESEYDNHLILFLKNTDSNGVRNFFQ